MDRYDSRLVFPRLIYDGEVRTEHPSGQNGGQLPAYRLQWADDGEDPCLPQAYRRHVDQLVFIPSADYLHSIRHYAMLSQSERLHMIHSADSCVRGKTLDASFAAANTAFMLLADCRYDTVTKYYSRDPGGHVLENAMRYRFWRKQLYRAGRDTVRDHAGLPKLNEYLISMTNLQKETGVPLTEDEVIRVNAVQGFLNAISVYEKEMEPHVAGPTVAEDKGPSEVKVEDMTPSAQEGWGWENSYHTTPKGENEPHLREIQAINEAKWLERDFKAPDYSNPDWQRTYPISRLFIAMGRPPMDDFCRHLNRKLGLVLGASPEAETTELSCEDLNKLCADIYPTPKCFRIGLRGLSLPNVFLSEEHQPATTMANMLKNLGPGGGLTLCDSPTDKEIWENTKFEAKRIYGAMMISLKGFKKLAADYGLALEAGIFADTKFSLVEINYLLGKPYDDYRALIEDMRAGTLKTTTAGIRSKVGDSA